MAGVPPVSRETTAPAEPEAEVRHALEQRYPSAASGLRAYASLLTSTGVERGLLGPREQPRLWSRHLANSAVIEELVPTDAVVVDVGSGAGLPGLPLALVRADLRLVLVEPLLRRSTFLAEVVAELGLEGRVDVRRARAEDLTEPLGTVVTARAVAPLVRLAGWVLPLVAVGGELLALKGSQAQDELRAAQPALTRLGAGPPRIAHCGAGVVDPPTTVVRVPRQRVVPAARSAAPGQGRRRR